MRNIRLVIEFDGSRYDGWQKQARKGSNTVQDKIEAVLEKMEGKPVELIGAGRTEAGVHAYAQVANFKTDSKLKMYEIKHYLNRYLPMDIAVTEIELMQERFHASLNAESKIYLYRLSIAEVPSVFERKYVYHAFKKPDVDLMKQAALLMVGKHDFKNFSTVKKSKSTVKEVYDIDIYDDGNEIQFTIHANDFLHNMARMMIGTLIDIGLGNRKKEDVEKLLLGDNKVAASAPADPKGLFLQEVVYK